MAEITLNTVPSNLRVPLTYFEFGTGSTKSGPGNFNFQVLFLGQRRSTGLVNAGVLTRIFSPTHAEQAFGLGSQLATMLKDYKGIDGVLNTWAIALDDDEAGVASYGTLAFTVGESGLQTSTLTLWIDGVRLRLLVTPEDTGTTIATSVITAINANPRLPVTAATVEGQPTQVKVTCNWKGVSGNDIDIRTVVNPEDTVPAGLTVAITAMANGAANPDITNALLAMGDTWFKIIVMGYNDADNIGTLNTQLANLWGPVLARDSMAFLGFKGDGTVGSTTTFGETQNTQLLCCMATGKSPTSPWRMAAITAAQAAPSYQADPARPVGGYPLTGFIPPATADRFDWYDRNDLLFDGISTYRMTPAGVPVIDRLITMLRVDQQGAQTNLYLDVGRVMTLSYLRFSVNNYIPEMFPNCKLMADPSDPSVQVPDNVVTPSIALNAICTLCRTDWIANGLVQDYDAFKASALCEIDDEDGTRLNFYIDPTLVNGFMISAGQINFQ